MKNNIGLFRHAARLASRSQGRRDPGGGVPTIFTFEATNLTVQLHSFGETSPFHDLPDDAEVYVEIGVDTASSCTQLAVKQAAIEFARRGHRPKFGPPLDEPDLQSAADAAYEQGAILDWISDALAGKPVSDFAESFALVRAVQALRMECDALRQQVSRE